jgi:hypothetical protein
LLCVCCLLMSLQSAVAKTEDRQGVLLEEVVGPVLVSGPRRTSLQGVRSFLSTFPSLTPGLRTTASGTGTGSGRATSWCPVPSVSVWR